MPEDIKKEPEGTSEEEFDATKIDFKDLEEAKKKYFGVHKDLQKYKSKTAEEKTALETELNAFKEEAQKKKEAEKLKKEQELKDKNEFEILLSSKETELKELEKAVKAHEQEIKPYKQFYDNYKNKLLEKLPAGDRDTFKDLSAEQLEIIIGKIDKTDSFQKPSTPPGQLNEDDINKLSDEKKRLYFINHAQALK